MTDKLVTVTVKLTFNADECVDVDPADYNPEPDLVAIMGFGIDHYNLEDWEIIK